MAVSLNRTSPLGDFFFGEGRLVRVDTSTASSRLGEGVTSSKARCWSSEEGMHSVSLMPLSFWFKRLNRGFLKSLISVG